VTLFAGEDLGQVGIGKLAPDGSVFISDYAMLQVLLRDPQGRIHRFGREGMGPGEFASIGSISLIEDTLWVIDARQRRISGFNRSGSFVRTQTLPVPKFENSLMAGPIARLLNDQWLYEPNLASSRAAEGLPIVTPIVVVSSTGKILDTLATRARASTTLLLIGSRGRVATRQPFDDGPLLATNLGSDAVLIDRAAGAAETVPVRMRLWSSTPQLVCDCKLAITTRPVSAATVDSVVQAKVKSLTGRVFGPGEDAKSQIRSNLYVPRFMPAVTRVLLGIDRSIFLEIANPRGDGPHWMIVDSKGQVQGTFSLPGDTDLLDASRGSVLLLATDPSGEQRVVRYSLR
jgi:hypothetical protein